MDSATGTSPLMASTSQVRVKQEVVHSSPQSTSQVRVKQEVLHNSPSRIKQEVRPAEVKRENAETSNTPRNEPSSRANVPSSSSGRPEPRLFIPFSNPGPARKQAPKRRTKKGKARDSGPSTTAGRVIKKKIPRKRCHRPAKKRRLPQIPMSSSGTETNSQQPETPSNVLGAENVKLEDDDEVQVIYDSDITVVAEIPPSVEPDTSNPEEEEEDVVILEDQSNSNKENIREEQLPNRRLRPIVIDGSNVAMAHGRNKVFSWQGIQICINYFVSNGHREIRVFVPEHRNRRNPDEDRKLIDDLVEKGFLIFTPSRFVNRQLIVSEDDRFIIEYATKSQGVIVSRDQYRDIMPENEEWRRTVEQRLLQFTFVGDLIMFPVDPAGKNGPHLADFLSFPEA